MRQLNWKKEHVVNWNEPFFHFYNVQHCCVSSSFCWNSQSPSLAITLDIIIILPCKLHIYFSTNQIYRRVRNYISQFVYINLTEFLHRSKVFFVICFLASKTLPLLIGALFAPARNRSMYGNPVQRAYAQKM